MTTVLLCLCGDTKPDHVMGKRACNRCGTCDSFELDGEVPASSLTQDLAVLEVSDPAVAEASARVDESTAAIVSKARFAAGGLIPGPFFHGSEQATDGVPAPPRPFGTAEPSDAGDFGAAEMAVSTSARLRRVEQERDEVLEAREVLREQRDLARAELASSRTELAARTEWLSGERDSFRAQRDHLTADVRGLVADLAQLRAELEQRTAERDKAYAANGELLDELERVRALLEHAEQHARDLQDNGVVPPAAPAVIASHVRYLCETCGARYGIAYDDHEHGPLTPVTVTIARQGAPAA